MDHPSLQVNRAGTLQSVQLGSQPLTIGRHDSNQLVIDDSMASRFHCVLERAPGGAPGYVLRDLQSRNGTHLNGQRVMHAVLKAGDIISIGDIEMTLLLPG